MCSGWAGAHQHLISNEHSVWFHDGQTSSKECVYIGELNLFHRNDLSTCDGKQAVLAIYAQKGLVHAMHQQWPSSASHRVGALHTFNCGYSTAT